MAENKIQTITIVGTGLIGAGWAARYTNRGINVIATDISADKEEPFRNLVNAAYTQLDKLVAVKPEKRGSITFTTDFEKAVQAADFIQENAPDNVDLKRGLIQKISKFAKPDVIIASSSSNLKPSDIQCDAINPERVIIGHPFNPVYLCPICELVTGKQTSKETLDRAYDFYLSVGMKPLHVKKEVDGYIGNRLQEAMWREILYLIRDGVATTKDIDDAIIYGFGMRLAFMGTCLTYHLGGGQGGMKHLLEHFGPSLKDPISYMVAPELTDELSQKLIDGVEEETDGMSIDELSALRDDCLIGIIKVLSEFNYGSGKVLNEDKARLQENDMLL